MDIEHSFAAILDILGFSNLVKNNSDEDIGLIFDNILTNALETNLAYGHSQDRPGGGVEANLRHSKINSLSIFDTVMLWTNDDKPESFMDLFAMLGDFVQDSFLVGLPLRGAVVEGPITVKMEQRPAASIVIKMRVVGKMQVYAHELEASQSWSGCIFHPSALNHYEVMREKSKSTLPSIDNLRAHGHILNFKVPMKEGDSNYDTLNWTMNTRGNLDDTLDEGNVERPFRLWNRKPESEREAERIDKIIANTKRYINYARGRSNE